MPSVVADLGGLELYGWVGALYMLAMTVTIPIHGKLADLWGRKPVILVGIVTFLVGSMACGVAPSMGALICARVVQGIGAGGVQPIAMTIVGDMFPPKERAKMQGVFGAVWGVAAIVGPIFGGLIVRALSWRWVFYFNVPFGLLAITVLSRSRSSPADGRRGARRPMDFAGAALCRPRSSRSSRPCRVTRRSWSRRRRRSRSRSSCSSSATHEEPLLPMD